MKELTFLCPLDLVCCQLLPHGVAAWPGKGAADHSQALLTQTPFHEFILILNILNFVLSITIELYFKELLLVVLLMCVLVCVVHACYWMHVDVRS